MAQRMVLNVLAPEVGESVAGAGCDVGAGELVSCHRHGD
jgi:hypothetical protein